MDEEYDLVEEENPERDEAEENEKRLGQLIQHLDGKLKDAVDHKEPVERRWLRDERQYWGVEHGLAPWDSYSGEDQEDDLTITENKTRQKTRTIAARISDMLFPTNDRNYALKAPALPTDIDGQPIDKKTADAVARLNEQTIHDYLTECNYPKSGRKSIYDGCRLGSGVLKGPFSSGYTRKVARRVYEPVMELHLDPETGEEFEAPMIDPQTGEPAMEDAGVELHVVTETRPAVNRVDPWMWFPAPARNIEECEHSFELHLCNKEQLRDYARYPDFDPRAIERVLKSTPELGHVRGVLVNRLDMLRNTQDRMDNLYPVWEYHGPLEPEQAQMLGIELPESELSSIFAEIWFCQGQILRVQTTAIDNDHRIPYYVWNYEEDESDLFGYGVPFIMRNEQYVMDKTYSAMVHNSQLTSGPQSLEFLGKVEPADGKKRIRGPKHWIAKDADLTDFREAIQFHNIESAIANIMPVYELANNNANENTSLPLMMGDGQSQMPHETTSGLAMMMNATNIVQRMAAHNWDDNVTLPMLRRFYYWILLYGENDDLKIDMEIEPRGASYLLVKDIQAQHSMNLMAMANNDPEFKEELHMSELRSIVINYLDLPTDRLLKTDEEKQQEAEAKQQEMEMQQRMLQAELAEQEGKAEKAMAEAEKARAEAHAALANEQDPEKSQMDFMLKMRDHELREQEIMASLYRIDAQLQDSAAKIASQENIKAAELEMKREIEGRREQVRNQIDMMNVTMKERKMDQDEYLTGMRMAVDMKREQNRRQNIQMGKDAFRS